MSIPKIEQLPAIVHEFGINYVQWREDQNQSNNDSGKKRVIDAIVGKLGEYELHRKFNSSLAEPDYGEYVKPKFGADLTSDNNFKLHVKMCSWFEMEHSGGWLISKYDPIVKMKEDHENNILVFGYVTEPWKTSFSGWCYVNEMHDGDICYYGPTRVPFLAARKYGIWPKDAVLNEVKKVYGVIDILRPIEELGKLLE